MSQALSVYITCENRTEALRIAEAVVAERLAACANVLAPVTSVFRWEGRIEQAEEGALILKTTQDNLEKLEKRIVELHSYDVPCIVAWPIIAGHAPYLTWIHQETQ